MPDRRLLRPAAPLLLGVLVGAAVAGPAPAAASEISRYADPHGRFAELRYDADGTWSGTLRAPVAGEVDRALSAGGTWQPTAEREIDATLRRLNAEAVALMIPERTVAAQTAFADCMFLVFQEMVDEHKQGLIDTEMASSPELRDAMHDAYPQHRGDIPACIGLLDLHNAFELSPEEIENLWTDPQRRFAEVRYDDDGHWSGTVAAPAPEGGPDRLLTADGTWHEGAYSEATLALREAFMPVIFGEDLTALDEAEARTLDCMMAVFARLDDEDLLTLAEGAPEERRQTFNRVMDANRTIWPASEVCNEHKEALDRRRAD